MEKQRVIAIVGRPNVGKSALFNRLVGRRLAIVHEQSGVTRDRLRCEVIRHDQHFDLIDTGGIGLLDGETARDTIEHGTREQVDLAVEDAAAVIFVVDLTDGVVPLDEEVARILHQSGRPVILAANKADHAGLDAQAGVFERLGFPTFPISALHNRGVGEVIDEALAFLPDMPHESIKDPLKIAIVGRPNAGKSSYINRLLNSKRVLVSEIAGTTRDSIEVPFTVGRGDQARHYLLIDTAGMRKARKVKDAVEKFSVIRAEKTIARADVVVIVLDATEGPKNREKRIAALAMEHLKGVVLLVNKWDLADGITTQRAYGKALREVVPFLDFVPLIFASATTGYNIRRTIDTIDYVAEQVSTHLTTGLLNRVLRDATARVQPPMVEGKRLKLYYATQVNVRPIIIRLFVNAPRLIKPAYKQYLINQLRQAFGLEGAPVILQFRARNTRTK